MRDSRGLLEGAREQATVAHQRNRRGKRRFLTSKGSWRTVRVELSVRVAAGAQRVFNQSDRAREKNWGTRIRT